MLSDADVGRRVVVRRRLDATARPTMSDTIGLLVGADADGLLVRPDRGGPDVMIPLPHVVAAKPVPPRRRRIGVDALALLNARMWPAPDTEWLGDWQLRAADGFTGRANSALVVGDPGLSLPEALGTVTDWYRRRGLRPACQLPLPAAADIDQALAAAGWQASGLVVVLAAPIGRPGRAPGPAGLPPVRLADAPSSDWLALLAASKGDLPPAAHAVLAGGRPTFAEVRDESGTLIAAARSALADQHLGLFAIGVVPAHRRRGLARHVIAALTAAAIDHAHTATLQVTEDNEPALALYRRLGFVVHHTYRYRRAPAGS